MRDLRSDIEEAVSDLGEFLYTHTKDTIEENITLSVFGNELKLDIDEMRKIDSIYVDDIIREIISDFDDPDEADWALYSIDSPLTVDDFRCEYLDYDDYEELAEAVREVADVLDEPTDVAGVDLADPEQVELAAATGNLSALVQEFSDRAALAARDIVMPQAIEVALSKF